MQIYKILNISKASLADDRKVASGSNDCTVNLWESFPGECLYTLASHEGSVNYMSLGSKARILASCSEDKFINFWEPEKEGCLKTLEGHHGPVYCISFLQDDQTMVSGFADRTLRVWDSFTGDP